MWLTRLRGLLGRVTMYRVVSLVLLALVLVALVQAATSRLDPSIFSIRAMTATLAVLLATSVITSHLLALTVQRRPHTESAVITALLLWFLYWPTTDVIELGWLTLAAFLAQASKYALAWRGRHVFNPAAAGVALLVVIGALVGDRAGTPPPMTTWWVASEAMLPYVAAGALLVLYRTGRWAPAVAFTSAAALLTYTGALVFAASRSAALEYTAFSTPIVFFAGFMLSEPLTQPPRRRQQVALALVAAAVFAWPLCQLRFLDTPVGLGPFEGTFELALLVVNLVAFGFGQRGGIVLCATGTRRLGGDVYEFAFTPRRPLRFQAGQYLELQISHFADIRGVRRLFTIVSVPGGDEVRLATRIPEDCSSFKRLLAGLEPGAEVFATGIQGDFVWPAGDEPLLLVAGGIGVTPFLSQLRSAPGRDAVLVYGAASGSDLPYRAELAESGVPVVLVCPDSPGELPPGWTHVRASAVTGDLVRAAVADHARRRAFVSGPSVMVQAVAADLRRSVLRVHTDHFTGY
ncbi:MAG: hypothetical protein QM597_10320 [Aeromicrobium sp.]|uniref:FAD-dependent oxidoreductase n=1 Tax=Aeromicrobium sp. TaxID=1871063 RepID=UPI0039E32D02